MAISETVHVDASPDVETDGLADADDGVDEGALGFVPDRTRRYTANEVRALNAANPTWLPLYECVGGRLLVTPSARVTHDLVCTRLSAELSTYCRAHFPDGVVCGPRSDISWGGRKHTVQPDVFVMPRGMARAAAAEAASVRGWRKITHLLLVAEVPSRGTAANDRGIKRRLYQRQRVPLYWIVDVDQGAVEEWTPDAAGARVERERLVWHPDGAAVAFELALAELFRPV